jgi:hypothetical protein
LLNFLRDHLPFGEIPIKLYLQPRKRDDQRDEIQTEHIGANAKPGEQWEGAFDEDLGPDAYGETGFEDVSLEQDTAEQEVDTAEQEQEIEIYDEEDDQEEEIRG